jgi:hypothetical protein
MEEMTQAATNLGVEIGFRKQKGQKVTNIGQPFDGW